MLIAEDKHITIERLMGGFRLKKDSEDGVRNSQVNEKKERQFQTYGKKQKKNRAINMIVGKTLPDVC